MLEARKTIVRCSTTHRKAARRRGRVCARRSRAHLGPQQPHIVSLGSAGRSLSAFTESRVLGRGADNAGAGLLFFATNKEQALQRIDPSLSGRPRWAQTHARSRPFDAEGRIALRDQDIGAPLSIPALLLVMRPREAMAEKGNKRRPEVAPFEELFYKRRAPPAVAAALRRAAERSGGGPELLERRGQ